MGRGIRYAVTATHQGAKFAECLGRMPAHPVVFVSTDGVCELRDGVRGRCSMEDTKETSRVSMKRHTSAAAAAWRRPRTQSRGNGTVHERKHHV